MNEPLINIGVILAAVALVSACSSAPYSANTASTDTTSIDSRSDEDFVWLPL